MYSLSKQTAFILKIYALELFIINFSMFFVLLYSQIKDFVTVEVNLTLLLVIR